MKITAKRTQIYLPTDLHQQASTFAKGKGQSLAQVIRISLADFLERKHRPSKRVYEKDPIWKLAGMMSGKERDLSTQHDHYLYGRPKIARS